METRPQTDDAFRELAEIVAFTGALSAKLHGLTEAGEILQTTIEHFTQSKRYAATVLLLTDDRAGLRIALTSLGRRDVRAGEKAASVDTARYSIALTKSPIFRRVVEEEATVVVTVDKIVADLFPTPVAKLLTKVLGYQDRQSILTPLRRHGEVIGVLGTSAPCMPEHFVPSVVNLANHVSTALDLADQYADRRRATEELRTSEARYRALFEQAAEAIVLADVGSGAVVEFNDRAHENLGYTREELAQLTVLDFLDASAVNAVLGDGTDTLETHCRVKGGDLIDILVSSRRISIGGDAFVQMTWRDITARNDAREALRQSEARYRSLVTNIPDVVWTTDSLGVTTFISPNVEQVIGYTQEEVYRRGADVWLGRVHPDDLERVKLAFAALFEKGAPYDVQYRYRHKEGHWICLHDRSVSQRESEGSLLADGVVSDVTQLREMQATLMRQEKLAVMGQLAGGVGHELRNPLGAIKNAAYFLDMALEKPEPEVREAIEILGREVDTCERIISSLLGFARPQSPTRRSADVNALVEQALAGRQIPDNVQVVRRLDSSVPAIQADPDQLVQVLGNIVVNAIQAMPDGGRLTLRTAKERDRPRGVERVSISVSDTGVGIPEEHKARIFQPLFTTKARGIGLGLALASALTEAHGGKLEVKSEVGKGSTFTVILPVKGMPSNDDVGGPS